MLLLPNQVVYRVMNPCKGGEGLAIELQGGSIQSGVGKVKPLLRRRRRRNANLARGCSHKQTNAPLAFKTQSVFRAADQISSLHCRIEPAEAQTTLPGLNTLMTPRRVQ